MGTNPEVKREMGSMIPDSQGHLKPCLAFALEEQILYRNLSSAFYSCINSWSVMYLAYFIIHEDQTN